MWHLHFPFPDSENDPDLPSPHSSYTLKSWSEGKTTPKHQTLGWHINTCLISLWKEAGWARIVSHCSHTVPAWTHPWIQHLLSHNNIKQLELKRKVKKKIKIQMTWGSPQQYISISICCTSFLLVRIFCPPPESYLQRNQNRYIKWPCNLMQLFYSAKEVISRTLSRPGFKGMLPRVTYSFKSHSDRKSVV